MMTSCSSIKQQEDPPSLANLIVLSAVVMQGRRNVKHIGGDKSLSGGDNLLLFWMVIMCQKLVGTSPRVVIHLDLSGSTHVLIGF